MASARVRIRARIRPALDEFTSTDLPDASRSSRRRYEFVNARRPGLAVQAQADALNGGRRIAAQRSLQGETHQL
jgi:hypothetical protein